MNRVQVDVTAFESLYQDYKLTKEELETEKEEILAELRGSTGYFASARADRHRADIEAFYETGTGKAALSQTEGMIKATKKATEDFMALQDYCLKLENFDSGIPAMGSASIENGVSHSQFLFDPDAKKAFHTAKASMIADAMLVKNLLVQVADSLEQYGRSVSSDEIRSAYEQVKTINNLDKALDILESETESAVSQISGMLAGQISDGALSGLSADEVNEIEKIANNFHTNVYTYIYNEDLYNNNSLYQKTVDRLSIIELVNVDEEELQKILDAYNSNKQHYISLADQVGVPPILLAAIHYRENRNDFINGTFRVYIHNGQTLGKTTTIAPIGKYFNDFDEAVLDAFNNSTYFKSHMKKLGLSPDNEDLSAMVTFSLIYNGWANDGKTSYAYSGTNMSPSGHYTSDGVYEDVPDKNLGTYVVLLCLLQNQEKILKERLEK